MILILLAHLMALSGAVLADSSSNVLAFRNGDSVHGALLGIDSSRAVRWRHAAASGDLVFACTNIDTIDFVASQPGPAEPVRQIVSLSNGDTLRGQVETLDDGVVKVSAAGGRSVLVPRPMIASIAFPHFGGKLLYSGPDGMIGWSQPPVTDGVGWVFDKGELLSRYPVSIGRPVTLPKTAVIEFSCVDEQPLAFRFDFYSDRPLGFQPTGFFMELRQSTVLVSYVDRNTGQRDLGGTRQCPYIPGGRMNYRLCVNGKTSEITLFVNGATAGSWKVPADAAFAGNVIGFQPRTVGTLRVSGIRVSEWDGRLPNAGDDAKDPLHDVVHLTNGDSAAGRMKSIVNGVALIQTDFTTATLPIERIARIDLAATNRRRARFFADDVWLYYPDQGRLTLRIEAVTNDVVSGYSENVGHVAIPLREFRRMRLNPYANFDDPEFAELPF